MWEPLIKPIDTDFSLTHGRRGGTEWLTRALQSIDSGCFWGVLSITAGLLRNLETPSSFLGQPRITRIDTDETSLGGEAFREVKEIM